MTEYKYNENNNVKSIMQWSNCFERRGNFPLDRTDLHSSYDDARAYAKGDGNDERKLGKLAYIGQIITVYGKNESGEDGVWVYSLVPSDEEGVLAILKPVGSDTVKFEVLNTEDIISIVNSPTIAE